MKEVKELTYLRMASKKVLCFASENVDSLTYLWTAVAAASPVSILSTQAHISGVTMLLF